MSDIKSVALAGASGTLGPHILKALVDADFQVTVLTRAKKTGAADQAKIKYIEVDFASVDDLTAALKGIDAVVSAVAPAAIESQIILVDAAVAAGVKRFIPSEFGACTTSPKTQGFPLYTSMSKVKLYLQAKAKEGSLTWTILAIGAFLEFLFATPLLVDFANHKATLFDEGDNRLSSTSLPNIGKAVVGILKNSEATKNKVVKVSEIILSQNKLLRIAKGLRPDIKWETSKVKTTEILQEGLDRVAAGEFTDEIMLKILKGTAFSGDVYEAAYDVTDNELFSIKELTEEELTQMVAGKLV